MLRWQDCPCGDLTCRTMMPTNFGNFYQGSGFRADEREILDCALAYMSTLAAPLARACEMLGTLEIGGRGTRGHALGQYLVTFMPADFEWASATEIRYIGD